MTIGVLALQGDVREHLRALRAVGARGVLVRRPSDLVAVQGLVIPGGESTTIDKLSRSFGLREPVITALANGLPAYGSCAGMILLADRLIDGQPDQLTFGGLDVTVRRNAFGRQIDSFDGVVPFVGLPGPVVQASFIRAPWVEEAGPGVEVLGRVVLDSGADRIVAVRQGALLATSFHPEVTGDLRVHQLFVDMVKERA
ncbi:MAG: pyridoxal 5'-phosphate synthase glutaminase subunit PdxT [Actinomycetota bacterium]